MNHLRILGALALGWLAGCSMCQDKWDYSSPTKGSAPVTYQGTTSRAGSAFTQEGPIANSEPTDAPVMPAAPDEVPSKPWDADEDPMAQELDSTPSYR